MCFLVKFMMERVLLLMVMPTLLLANLTQKNTADFNMSSTPTVTSFTLPNTSDHNRGAVDYSPVQGITVGSVMVEWDKSSQCQGRVMLLVNFTKSKPLCALSATKIQTLGNTLCKNMRCGKFLRFRSNNVLKEEDGYFLTDTLTVTDQKCVSWFIECKDVANELLAYKVVTGLLLVLVLAVILFRFAWPTYLAVRKRFSQKQQSRWIGPTQTQSVSYHRGQGGHLQNDTGKRQSFPGLERLSVNPSREPSSNRNSDYDSYGF